VTRVSAGGAVFEVDAVAFDKDGTLIDLDAAWGPAARAWVETAAGGDTALAEVLAADMGLEIDTEHLVGGGLFAVGTVGQLYEATLSVLSRHGIDADGSVTRAREAREMSALAGEKGNLVALGDVIGTFESLRDAGLRLAIVSSDDRSAIDAAIETLGIGPFLATVVAGNEGILPKPAPDVLVEAARRMGAPAGRMLYVGDSWVDAAAGQSAGVAGTVLVGDLSPETASMASAVLPAIDSLRVL
jgi:HAD superfamily hydrolase (TIGR01549 family)